MTMVATEAAASPNHAEEQAAEGKVVGEAAAAAVDEVVAGAGARNADLLPARDIQSRRALSRRLAIPMAGR